MNSGSFRKEAGSIGWSVLFLLIGCLPERSTGLYNCSKDGWCRSVQPVTNQSLRKAWGTAPDDVWVVGQDTTILRWKGADGWTLVSTPLLPGVELTSVWGSSKNDVWVSGIGIGVAHWNGTEWNGSPRLCSGSLDGEIWAIRGLSEGDVWMVGSQGRLWHWDGVCLKAWPSPTMVNMRALFGRSPRLWAVGDQQTIIAFDGMEWRLLSTNRNAGAYLDISGTDSTLWVVGEYGAIAQSTDGISFSVVSVPDSTNLRWNAIWTLPNEESLIGGTFGAIVRLSASGAYVLQDSGTQNTLWSIWAADSNQAWIIGTGGLILNYQG